MKRILFFILFMILMQLCVFANENIIQNPSNEFFKFKFINYLSKNNKNTSSLIFSSTSLISNNKINYASGKIPQSMNLRLGIGFMISGQVLFWLLGLSTLAAGIVLLNYQVVDYVWSDGTYSTYAPYHTQGLILTITGGLCIVTGIVFIIVGGINLGLAAKKKTRSNKRRAELFQNVFIMADYDLKKENLVLGAKFLL